MNTRVVWQSAAFEHMAKIVRAAPARKAEFAAALQELFAVLTADPEGTGESRDPPYRVVIIGELTFRFLPAPDEDRAYIVWVRIWKARH